MEFYSASANTITLCKYFDLMLVCDEELCKCIVLGREGWGGGGWGFFQKYM